MHRLHRSAGVVDTLFISRQGHFSCPCRTGAVMLGSTARALSPTATTSQLTRSLQARRLTALRFLESTMKLRAVFSRAIKMCLNSPICDISTEDVDLFR